jgi:hypothetical protein
MRQEGKGPPHTNPFQSTKSRQNLSILSNTNTLWERVFELFVLRPFYYIHGVVYDVFVDPFMVPTFVVCACPLHLCYFAMSGTLKDGKTNLSFNGNRDRWDIFRKELRSRCDQNGMGWAINIGTVMVQFMIKIVLNHLPT